jgi:cytochrome c biogenesis protein CcmG, thiol:disulfide interchange protein DsbE
MNGQDRERERVRVRGRERNAALLRGFPFPSRLRAKVRAASPAAKSPMARALAIALLTLATACAPDRPPEVGDRAPAYTAPDLDGGRLALAELHGEVVVLNIWATWCYPCRREMPGLQELQDQLGHEGLRVVAVSIDGAGEGDAIRAFLDEHRIGFDILHDPAQRITRAFGTLGVPETFLIGRDGTVLHRWIGRIDTRAPFVRGPIYAALAG